jgi:hypothetical protein
VPCLLAYRAGKQADEAKAEDKVLLYESITNHKPIDIYSLETIHEIAEQVHAQHLVKEWREEEHTISGAAEVSSESEQPEQ